MGIGDIRYTLLQTVNEVLRKLGLNSVSTTNGNKLAVQLVDFINDVCSDLSDFGNWQETVTTANVTCVSGQSNYTINTSANIKNIGDVYFSQRRGPLTGVTIDEMRVLTRVTINGTPAQYTVFGTDANGNPNIRVRPRPGASEDGALFSVLFYIRAPLYVAGSDDALIIPYPARIVVLGTLARQILNESGGAPTERFQLTYQDYLNARKEALNRFNGDTGWNTSFVPARGRRRR